MNDVKVAAPQDTLVHDIRSQGFARRIAGPMRNLLGETALGDWHTFADSWDDLGLDLYMADGGRYRQRRFAVFSLSAQGIVHKPHQPHYQSRDYNALNGGIERWFEPVTDAVAGHAVTRAALTLCRDVFTPLTEHLGSAPVWHTEMHQFRIVARLDAAGLPTPEGPHRDGVDWVLVMLVRRRNVASGVTSICTLDRQPLGSFTLTDPLDAVFVDDNRILHGVTPITPIDPDQPAYRDVLVVTLRREETT